MLPKERGKYVLLHGNFVPNLLPRADELIDMARQKPYFDFLLCRAADQFDTLRGRLGFKMLESARAIQPVGISQEEKQVKVLVLLYDFRHEPTCVSETADPGVGQYDRVRVGFPTLLQNATDERLEDGAVVGGIFRDDQNVATQSAVSNHPSAKRSATEYLRASSLNLGIEASGVMVEAPVSSSF